MSTVRVLGERVLVQELDAASKSLGGILLPGNAGKEPYSQAAIVAVGDLNEHAGVKVGDVVIFDPNSAIPVNVEGNKFFIVEEKKLLAVIE